VLILELNDNTLMRGIIFLQTTALRNGLASLLALMRYFIPLILFLVLIGIPRQANAALNDVPKPTSARLTVWVPSGVVGSDYWIYVNGHIVSAPPHPTSDAGSGVVAMKSKKGWQIFGQNGLVLKEIHDDGWDRDFSPYALDAESREALHLFQPVELPLSAGKYKIDMAVLLPGPFYKSSFPFVISAGWEVDVEPGKPKQLYLSVPDAWEQGIVVPAMAAQSNKACPGDVPSAPNRDEAKHKFSVVFYAIRTQLLKIWSGKQPRVLEKLQLPWNPRHAGFVQMADTVYPQFGSAHNPKPGTRNYGLRGSTAITRRPRISSAAAGEMPPAWRWP
jgi:hypothetical protein